MRSGRRHILIIIKPGDTTAYTTSWFIKEIYHQDNRHLDAVNKMRTEAAELGFADAFLGYSDTSV